MGSNRNDVLDWFEQGRIAPQKLRAALELSGTLPGATDWRRFLDRLLLWMGVVMLAAAVTFFFAFNWQEMGRLVKIGLMELLVLGALAFAWRLGIERGAGKSALLAASLLVGTLFALIGQIYQTGADTYELFAAWAAAILPWALVARFPALWILWLALVNLALALWEGLAAPGIECLRERWSVRILATASGALITALAVFDIVDWRNASGWGAPVWLGWLAAAYAVYRHLAKDVYVLVGGVLSVIVTVATFLAKHLHMLDGGEFLLIGLVVIGLSAAGGYWLKNVANEEDA